MDDLISRAAIFRLLDENGVVFRGEIEKLPAVDAAPVVHGNWIECYERSRHYYCSNCGKVQGIASVVMKYCPECGAKMAEHPEPVYPTWWEWLASIGAVTRKVKPDVASELIETGLLDPIPADLAQKLGIEPKEG